MKTNKLISVALISLAMALASGPMSAQDFEKGLAAAQTGDFETALHEWQPLADQGDTTAQTMLGWMYRTGRGVPKDFVEATK